MAGLRLWSLHIELAFQIWLLEPVAFDKSKVDCPIRPIFHLAQFISFAQQSHRLLSVFLIRVCLEQVGKHTGARIRAHMYRFQSNWLSHLMLWQHWYTSSMDFTKAKKRIRTSISFARIRPILIHVKRISAFCVEHSTAKLNSIRKHVHVE